MANAKPRKAKTLTKRKPNFVIVPNGDNTYYVADLNADPAKHTHGVKAVAHGFDSRGEAQEWINEQGNE